MSRSRKSVPIAGVTTASSDRRYKKQEHSRERTQVREALAKDDEPPHPKTYGNPWRSEKDGKLYHPDYPKALRK